MNKPNINVEVRVEDIKQMLFSSMNCKYQNVITDVIIDNLLHTPKGMQQLLLAFNGVRPNMIYKIGDSVLLDFSMIPSWSCDKDKMQTEGMVHQNFIKAVVTNINLQKLCSIELEFQSYDTSGNLKTFIYEFMERYVQHDEIGFLGE